MTRLRNSPAGVIRHIQYDLTEAGRLNGSRRPLNGSAREYESYKDNKDARKVISQALLNTEALALWRTPKGMKAHVHAFDTREGGAYRMSLTYTDPKSSAKGKTSEDTGKFQSKFIELVPYEKMVELIEFESFDPSFASEMTMTTSWTDVEEGTRVAVLCENLPTGMRSEDNERGCRSSLQNLARLVEKANS